MSAAVPIIAGASAGYSIFSGERARKDAKAEARDMKAQADAQNAAYLARQNDERRKKSAISMGLRRSLIAGASSPYTRGGTIKTSPLGIVPTGKETLGS